MYLEILKSKIAHARVTQADLHYEGSITIDENLIRAVEIIPGEKVDVVNLNNGNRFTTYVIAGPAGSGVICLNGPAARLGLVGDVVMIISYAFADQAEAKTFKPKIVHLNDRNQIKT
ncbi:MAG: aspartate 1-decarboxylase [Candidatus Omnitrophica bacterium]|nr:aspartate 1-decarboxylase [Candidatus Omnitrophota bacterium]